MVKGRTVELNCFSDASVTGMATVCYVQQQQESGDWTLSFLVGKARVSPATTPTTIPRLELNAAVLVAKLTDAAVRESEWTGSVYFHSDAQVVLKYIKAKEQRFPVYVAKPGEADKRTDGAEQLELRPNRGQSSRRGLKRSGTK